MSEIAGRLRLRRVVTFLKIQWGRGVLLGGVPGVAPAKVVVIGGGVVGTNAARVAQGMGARVVVLIVRSIGSATSMTSSWDALRPSGRGGCT